jgi:hypothetical protein
MDDRDGDERDIDDRDGAEREMDDRDGAEREMDDRLGDELGRDADLLDRLLLPELRRDSCPSTDEAASIVTASTRANTAALERLFFTTTNILQLLSPAVWHPGKPGLPFRCCRRFDASDEIGRHVTILRKPKSELP